MWQVDEHVKTCLTERLVSKIISPLFFQARGIHGKLFYKPERQHFQKCWSANLCVWCRESWVGEGHALLSDLLRSNPSKFTWCKDILSNTQDGFGPRGSERFGKILFLSPLVPRVL